MSEKQRRQVVRQQPPAMPEPEPALLPGVEIEMGGKTWTVPPLTLGQMRRLEREIVTLGTDMALTDSKTIGAVVAVVTAALRRNYADLDEAEVAELLDMGNAAQVFIAVLTGSGLKRDPFVPALLSVDGAMSSASSPAPLAGASPTLMP